MTRNADPLQSTGGRREHNKADKLHRIRQAARDLFVEKGYDGTTMRDISARAGVGFGTLFDYASGKRDLLFLIFNPALVEALNRGYESSLGKPDFIDKVMSVFESFYEFYSGEPALSRYLLRELNFDSEGEEAAKFMRHRADFLQRLAQIVEHGKAETELDPRNASALIAQSLLSVFAWEVRRWISTDTPNLRSGIVQLRALVSLQVRGFGAGPAVG